MVVICVSVLNRHGSHQAVDLGDARSSDGILLVQWKLKIHWAFERKARENKYVIQRNQWM